MGFLDWLIKRLQELSDATNPTEQGLKGNVRPVLPEDHALLTKEEGNALDVAQDMHTEPTILVEKTVNQVLKKGEEITTKKEIQTITREGKAESAIITTMPIVACGKTVSSERDIEGFCSVCEEAICKEHAKYCSGYESFACRKLLCPKHTLYFPDENGEQQPCCVDHFNMKTYYKKNVYSNDSRAVRKNKESKEKSDG